MLPLLNKLFILISFFSKFCSGSDEPPEPTEPLIDVIEGGMYTGQSLDNLIRSIREKLDSNVPAEEFKVCTCTSMSIVSLLRKKLLNLHVVSLNFVFQFR